MPQRTQKAAVRSRTLCWVSAGESCFYFEKNREICSTYLKFVKLTRSLKNQSPREIFQWILLVIRPTRNLRIFGRRISPNYFIQSGEFSDGRINAAFLKVFYPLHLTTFFFLITVGPEAVTEIFLGNPYWLRKYVLFFNDASLSRNFEFLPL